MWDSTGPTCIGTLQPNEFGSVIQDVGLNCASVANCIPFWDQYGQERSQLKRINITNFSGIGVGIFTSQAQNGGPFDDIQMAPGATATCVEVGGNGVGGAVPMRGIRGLTCTGSASGSGTGVDINTQNFNLTNAHFESLGAGVEIGALTGATGISVTDVTGGGKSTNLVTKIVDISNFCAASATTGCNSTATSDINLHAIFSPLDSSTTQRALVDNITGNTTSEATLGFYSLGDGSGGSGTGTSNTRPVLTTSSSFNGSLNALTLGVPGTTTGSLLLASSTDSSVSGGIGTKGKAVTTFDTTTPGNAAGFYKSSQILQVASSNFTTMSSSPVTITGLTFTTPTSLASNWSFHCSIAYSTSAASTVNFGIQGATTAPTNLMAMGNMYTTNAGAAKEGVVTVTNTLQTIVVSNAFAGASGNLIATLDGTLEAASNASPTALNIVASVTASATLTIIRGSFCSVN